MLTDLSFVSAAEVTDLREPLNYPNWMWMTGTALLLLSFAWILWNLWRWLRSSRSHEKEALLIDLDEERRTLYRSLLDDIRARRSTAEYTDADTRLALAGVLRALATERSGLNLEAATSSEIRELLPHWPQLAQLVAECDDSFRTDAQGQSLLIHEEVPGTPVEILMARAQEVITS